MDAARSPPLGSWSPYYLGRLAGVNRSRAGGARSTPLAGSGTRNACAWQNIVTVDAYPLRLPSRQRHA